MWFLVFGLGWDGGLRGNRCEKRNTKFGLLTVNEILSCYVHKRVNKIVYEDKEGVIAYLFCANSSENACRVVQHDVRY